MNKKFNKIEKKDKKSKTNVLDDDDEVAKSFD